MEPLLCHLWTSYFNKLKVPLLCFVLSSTFTEKFCIKAKCFEELDRDSFRVGCFLNFFLIDDRLTGLLLSFCWLYRCLLVLENWYAEFWYSSPFSCFRAEPELVWELIPTLMNLGTDSRILPSESVLPIESLFTPENAFAVFDKVHFFLLALVKLWLVL